MFFKTKVKEIPGDDKIKLEAVVLYKVRWKYVSDYYSFGDPNGVKDDVEGFTSQKEAIKFSDALIAAHNLIGNKHPLGVSIESSEV